MPRASLRPVLLICAFNIALRCRVSTQITGKPASARALKSHCDSGPASSPTRFEAIDGVRQYLQESFRLTRHPRFPHDLACIIHDADARFLDRHIESSKIVHAALLLLMLEAADADLASPSA